jgi:hypothetical protein
MTNENKEKIAKAPERRIRRTSLGARQILALANKEPGYEYRFVNDSADRVQRFLDAGWEMVSAEDVRIGDKRVNSPSPEGSHAVASVGQGMKAYVLRIKDEWYEEDQAAKQAQVNAIEDSTRAEALNGTYGTLEISRK